MVALALMAPSLARPKIWGRFRFINYLGQLKPSPKMNDMKFRNAVLFAYVIVGAIASFSSKAIAEPYLFELLTKPTYYKSWSALFVGERNIDSWLAEYAKTKKGVASQGRHIQLGKVGYQINTVCKTHECGNNEFFVLFAEDGTKAWGLLLTDRKIERFFGRPDEEKKKALLAAVYRY